MKKITLFYFLVFSIIISINAQTQEVGPYNGNKPNNSRQAIFDALYTLDIGSTGSTGVDGLAGVIFFNDQYWVSEWASNNLYTLDNTGALIDTFQIPNLTGTRSMTTDGTSIYIGTAGLQIFEIDPTTRTIISTINITTNSSALARMCTYDETLDSGNGGFWIGNFSSDIASVDMSGNELSVIPAATHQTVIYGGAIDNVSSGGPFLWIHDQSGDAPSQDFVTQLDPSTGAQTGVAFDYAQNGSNNGSTAGLAGGLIISNEVVEDKIALVGLCQCTPSNLIFAVELVDLLGVNDNTLSQITLYPNPANDILNVSVTNEIEIQNVTMYDVLGKNTKMNIENNQINISALSRGLYFLKIETNAGVLTRKIIKQ